MYLAYGDPYSLYHERVEVWTTSPLALFLPYGIKYGNSHDMVPRTSIFTAAGESVITTQAGLR